MKQIDYRSDEDETATYAQKRREADAIARDTAIFIKRGGKIKFIAPRDNTLIVHKLTRTIKEKTKIIDDARKKNCDIFASVKKVDINED